MSQQSLVSPTNGGQFDEFAPCIWLAGIEHRFWKMTIGVFVFVCQYLPEWLLRTLLETVGPAVVRMVRLMVALCIWLSVLLSPIVVSIAFGASFWADFGDFLWLVTAISGSIYGLYRVVKKKRARKPPRLFLSLWTPAFKPLWLAFFQCPEVEICFRERRHSNNLCGAKQGRSLRLEALSMSFFEEIGAFVVGFAQGFSQQCADQAPEDQGSHRFQSLMHALAEAASLRLLRVRHCSASFALSGNSTERMVVVVRKGRMIELSVCSAITFASGWAPREVARGLARKNEQLSGCKFDLAESDQGEFFTFDTTIHAGNLTPDFFVSALREMVPCIVSLDQYLTANGYVS